MEKKSHQIIKFAITVIIVIIAIVSVIAVIDSELKEYENRVIIVETWVNDQIEKNVIKQADKILSGNYDDIKVADLEDALKYFPLLENPSEQSVIAYEIVKEYYQQTIGYILPVLEP